MTNVTEQLKQGVGQALESLSDGWRELKSRAGGALTRFRAGDDKPARTEPSAFDAPDIGRWAFMAADVIDDAVRVFVRLEAPGMRRNCATCRANSRKRASASFFIAPSSQFPDPVGCPLS